MGNLIKFPIISKIIDRIRSKGRISEKECDIILAMGYDIPEILPEFSMSYLSDLLADRDKSNY